MQCGHDAVPKQCTWNSKRNAFIASRQRHGEKKQYKTFTPADDSFGAIHDARDEATAWASSHADDTVEANDARDEATAWASSHADDTVEANDDVCVSRTTTSGAYPVE